MFPNIKMLPTIAKRVLSMRPGNNRDSEYVVRLFNMVRSYKNQS